MLEAMARSAGIPFRRTIGAVSADSIKCVPGAVAREYRIFPLLLKLGEDMPILEIAIPDATDLDLIDILRYKLRLQIAPVVVPPPEIEKAIASHYKDS